MPQNQLQQKCSEACKFHKTKQQIAEEEQRKLDADKAIRILKEIEKDLGL